jgi:hypothetical protein
MAAGTGITGDRTRAGPEQDTPGRRVVPERLRSRHVASDRKQASATMIDQTPSDDGISAMVDIARLSGQNLNPAQHRELDRLLADGLIEKVAPASNARPRNTLSPPKAKKFSMIAASAPMKS